MTTNGRTDLHRSLSVSFSDQPVQAILLTPQTTSQSDYLTKANTVASFSFLSVEFLSTTTSAATWQKQVTKCKHENSAEWGTRKKAGTQLWYINEIHFNHAIQKFYRKPSPAMLVKTASEAFAKEPGLNKLSRIMEEDEA
eukprot:scaffold8024_cov64-Cylindrotheca_fusiformis.AAC.1